MIGEWIKSLDGLLRGETTRLTALRRGTLDVPCSGLAVLIIVLGAFYGACMASFAAFNKPGASAILQIIASAGKVPLLFFLTLAVTFPSLYVFNALIGSRLTLAAVWQLLIATLAVMIAVLASLGPVVAFFSVSTTGYNFMLLFNVVICAASGFLGLKFLLFTLHRLTTAMEQAHAPAASTPPIAGQPKPSATQQPTMTQQAPGETNQAPGVHPAASTSAASTPPAAASVESPPHREPRGALEKMEGHPFGADVTAIFRVWVVVFALVGAQMSWVLRPFIGAPDVAFSWLRARDSNFFEAVLRAVGHLIG